jgi:hypothetical protein
MIYLGQVSAIAFRSNSSWMLEPFCTRCTDIRDGSRPNVTRVRWIITPALSPSASLSGTIKVRCLDEALYISARTFRISGSYSPNLPFLDKFLRCYNLLIRCWPDDIPSRVSYWFNITIVFYFGSLHRCCITVIYFALHSLN